MIALKRSLKHEKNLLYTRIGTLNSTIMNALCLTKFDYGGFRIGGESKIDEPAALKNTGIS